MTEHQASIWLDLDVVPRKVFPVPPITIVICQIRFRQLVELSSQTITKLQKKLTELFPDVTKEQSSVPDAGSNQSTSWRFADLENNWAITLGLESVALETRAYVDFDLFRERFAVALSAIETVIRPKLCTRIGLRYVNEFRESDQQWQKCVRSELLGLAAVQEFNPYITQTISQTHLTNGDDRITIGHGIFPFGSVVSPKPDEMPLQTPFYLLDIDVAREFTGPSRFDIRKDKVMRIIEELHKTESRLFWWSITPEFASEHGER